MVHAQVGPTAAGECAEGRLLAGREAEGRPPEVLAGENEVSRRAENEGRPPDVLADEEAEARPPEVLDGENEVGRRAEGEPCARKMALERSVSLRLGLFERLQTARCVKVVS